MCTFRLAKLDAIYCKNLCRLAGDNVFVSVKKHQRNIHDFVSVFVVIPQCQLLKSMRRTGCQCFVQHFWYLESWNYRWTKVQIKRLLMLTKARWCFNFRNVFGKKCAILEELPSTRPSFIGFNKTHKLSDIFSQNDYWWWYSIFIINPITFLDNVRDLFLSVCVSSINLFISFTSSFKINENKTEIYILFKLVSSDVGFKRARFLVKTFISSQKERMQMESNINWKTYALWEKNGLNFD